MKTVLIVDDDQDLLSTLEDILRSEGYAVHCATDGADALREFQNIGPDIVLLDNNMPNMSGLEALSTLRKLDPKVPVVMITGLLNNNLISKATEYGANYFISKPPDFRLLLETIAGALNMVPECL